jgi:hypothetical protein
MNSKKDHYPNTGMGSMQVSEQRRQAYLLLSFRTLWVVVALATLLLVILSIKPRYQQLSNVTPNPVIPNGQLLPIEIQALAEIGVSIEFYAGWITFLEGVTAIEFLLLGMAVFLIRSKEWMPLIFALGTVGLGAYTSPLTSPLDDLTPTLKAVTLSMRAIMFSSLIVAFLLFPNGRFIPSWTKGLAVVWTAFNLASLIYQPFQMLSSMVWVEFTQVLLLLWAFFWLILIAVLQVYRYRRYSSAVERQQTKWVVYGLAVAVLVMMAAGIPFILLQILSTDPVTLIIARLVVVTVTLLALSFMGASFAVAILRFRLWDIDLIIRRTVVYGALTLTLLGIYFASVVLFQQIAQQLSGGSSPLAVIFSTLMIAALFSPLRRRIQNDIDKRFYRKKYDANVTLAGFAALAREEVDLERLSARLVEIVDETLQPEHVSVWLK